MLNKRNFSFNNNSNNYINIDEYNNNKGFKQKKISFKILRFLTKYKLRNSRNSKDIALKNKK